MTKAIILAAGKAPRLLPLTKDVPQCMLKVGNKTILEKQIENLKKLGIKEIVVVTGYLSEKLESLCKKIGVKTLFNPFYGVSGMALTLWVAKKELKDDFLFLYSDILFDPKIIEGLLTNKNDICLAIKKDGLREEAEKVIESEGIIKNVSKAEISEENGEFIGIAKFSKNGSEKLVKELNKVAKENINSSFIRIIDNMIENNETIAAYDVMDLQFIDIDFPEDLKRAEKLFI